MIEFDMLPNVLNVQVSDTTKEAMKNGSWFRKKLLKPTTVNNLVTLS